MPPPLENGFAWRLGQLEEWRREIEALKPEVQAEVLRRVEKRVEVLVKLTTTLLIAVLGAAASIVATLLILIAQGPA